LKAYGGQYLQLEVNKMGLGGYLKKKFIIIFFFWALLTTPHGSFCDRAGTHKRPSPGRPCLLQCSFVFWGSVWVFSGMYLGFQKGTIFEKGHLTWPWRCFHDTSKGNPLGIFLTKLAFGH
jgi:hypothetical protein